MSVFRLFLSNRLEILFDELCTVLQISPNAPLTPETIVVQSRGMQRWLSLRLAGRFGVWANDARSFPFPNAFIRESFSAVPTLNVDTSLFDPTALSWRILALLPNLLERPSFVGVSAYCGAQRDGIKRYQFARRIADLLDQYAVYRPDMLRGWEKGAGEGEAAWQAELWRELVQGAQGSHKAALLQSFLGELRNPHFDTSRLPQRVAVFGIPAMPPLHLAVFEALAAHVPVNLFLLNPSREYWGDILSAREAAKRKQQLSFDDYLQSDLHLGSGHALLASLGAQGRDFFRLLLDRLEFEEHQCFSDPQEDTLLHCLQSDILLLRERPDAATPAMTLVAHDRSVQVHSCHGPLREMEVLYDQLLDLFERTPGLSPDDVLVMIPDIESYAPYITAVFDGSGQGVPRIPFHIADRGVRAQSPLVQTFCNVLALPGSRFGAAQVLDILEAPAVYQCFGLRDQDLEAVREWVRSARIRWGRDAADRQRHGLPAYAENSWRAGLERLLLGFAMAQEDGLYGDRLPLDVVAGGNARPLGSFVDFIETLFECCDTLEQERSLREWAQVLEALVDRIFAAANATEAELEAIRRVLRELRESAALAQFTTPISLEVVRAHLNGQFEQSGAAQGFLAGGVTFGALLPMRSIPFRVIVLAGMNDGAFPRVDRPLGFDLMARHPQSGDRSLRREDRYLFLEALVSARDYLLITYVGQNQRDGSEAPPSVLVSELLDCIARGFRVAQGTILDHVVRKHHLQAFHPAYFAENTPLFSYSRSNETALAARAQGTIASKPLLAEPLAAVTQMGRQIDIRQVIRFLRHPQRYFLEERLGIRLQSLDEGLQEREALQLNELERYQLMSELIEEHLRGNVAAESYRRYRARGVLPPGAPGETEFAELDRNARRFVDTLEPLRAVTPDFLEMDMPLGEYRLVGRLLLGGKEGPLRYRFAQLKARDHLDAWVAHLVCCAMWESGCTSLLVGRDSLCRYAHIASPTAREWLSDLLDLYLQGHRQALRVFPQSSMAFATAVKAGKPADAALTVAKRVWSGSPYARGEGEDSWLRFSLRGSDPFTEDFCALALRVFQPLLNVLQEAK